MGELLFILLLGLTRCPPGPATALASPCSYASLRPGYEPLWPMCPCLPTPAPALSVTPLLPQESATARLLSLGCSRVPFNDRDVHGNTAVMLAAKYGTRAGLEVGTGFILH